MSTTIAFPRVEVHDRAHDDPAWGFANDREFLRAVMNHGRTGYMDARLKPLQPMAAAGADEHGAYSDPHGGFLVPRAFAPMTLSVATEDPTQTTPIPMGSPEVQIPARNDKNHTDSVSGGLVMYRRPETVEIPASRMQIEQNTLLSHTLAGLTFTTQRLIDDSPQSLRSVLLTGYTHERNATIVREKLFGSGVGEYQGIVKAGCRIRVEKESSQAGGSILAENIEEMESRCWSYHAAIWLCHPDHKKGLKRLTRTIGTGGSVVPLLTYTPEGRPLLSGRPIHFTDQCAAMGTEGDICCGVWSEYVEGIWRPLETMESIHVRFLSVEVGFRFIERGDGQPWWRVPMTLRNSSNTVSPFVTLADRT